MVDHAFLKSQTFVAKYENNNNNKKTSSRELAKLRIIRGSCSLKEWTVVPKFSEQRDEWFLLKYWIKSY